MLVKKKFWLVSGIVFLAINTGNTAKSQIVPDRTTPNTAVVGECIAQCQITGGILAQSHLFHSFQEFNVGAGESVYFADPGVANIFSRVTGGNLSAIKGVLGVSGGDANLFLLNPNGIIFGAGAILDVNGSFVATTADEIEFGDRGFFSANPHTGENLALLTVNPSAFFFNQMGQNNPITTEAGAVLTVPELENITFLGAQSTDATPGILIQGTTLKAPQGKVELGAVSEDAIIGIDSDFKLTFPDDVVQGDIFLTQGSAIDVSGVGGGSVEVQGRQLTLSEASRIFSDTLGDRDGGDINIQVDNLAVHNNSFISASTFDTGNGGNINILTDDSVEVTGKSIAAVQHFIASALSGEEPGRDRSSTIHTATYSNGTSGDIAIQTRELEVNNGAWIISSTVNAGAGGNIIIDVIDSVTLDGSGIITGSSANGTGKPGNLEITTQDLSIQNSGFISSSTLGQAEGGDLEIFASESVRLQKTIPGTIIPTGIYSNAVLGSGQAGNLTIDTETLVVKDGSQISASSGLIAKDVFIPLGGQGGNININASESVEVSGLSTDNIFVSSIVNDTRSHNPAGNLTINTGELLLQDSGLISASSIGVGDGGDITINAHESIELQGSGVSELQQIILDGLSGLIDFTSITGGFFSITVNGKAGNITLDTPKLNLEAGAIITTASLGRGNGGDLTINASEELNIIGSAIASPTLGDGDAGKISIDTENLLILDGGVIATATVAGGNAEDLAINATESVEISGTVPELLFAGSISSGSYGGQGLSGNLTINTTNLILKDGGSIDTTNTIFPGFPVVETNLTSSQGGDLTINASESIDISGSFSIDNSVSRIVSTTTTAAPASNIKITTDRLSVSDGGEIAVNSMGEGASGSLEIFANSINLHNGGQFNASTFSGRGGNINLQAEDILYLSDRSKIDTNAIGGGNSGNIEIDADFIVTTDSSTITANAIAGQGGNINIVVEDIFIAPDSYISASSELGIDGKINIKTFTNIDRNNLSNLPEVIIDVGKSIVQRCGSNLDGSLGEFTYVGRGGLPPSPLSDRQYDRTAIADLGIPNPKPNPDLPNQEALRRNTAKIPQAETIVEAQGWIINSNGNVVLTANASGVNSTADFSNSSCPF